MWRIDSDRSPRLRGSGRPRVAYRRVLGAVAVGSLITSAALLAPHRALAQDSARPCTEIENDTERLACYDRALRPARAPAPAAAPTERCGAAGPARASTSTRRCRCSLLRLLLPPLLLPSRRARPSRAARAAPPPTAAAPAPAAAAAAPAPAQSSPAEIMPIVVVNVRQLAGTQRQSIHDRPRRRVGADGQRESYLSGAAVRGPDQGRNDGKLLLHGGRSPPLGSRETQPVASLQSESRC